MKKLPNASSEIRTQQPIFSRDAYNNPALTELFSTLLTRNLLQSTLPFVSGSHSPTAAPLVTALSSAHYSRTRIRTRLCEHPIPVGFCTSYHPVPMLAKQLFKVLTRKVKEKHERKNYQNNQYLQNVLWLFWVHSNYLPHSNTCAMQDQGEERKKKFKLLWNMPSLYTSMCIQDLSVWECVSGMLSCTREEKHCHVTKKLKHLKVLPTRLFLLQCFIFYCQTYCTF